MVKGVQAPFDRFFFCNSGESVFGPNHAEARRKMPTVDSIYIVKQYPGKQIIRMPELTPVSANK
jgi:hypothetical protein